MSGTFVGAIARLSDPTNCCSSPRQFKELNEKISSTMTRLFRMPENGGNPFLFALSGPKPHELARELPGGRALDTAATDGKKFYWNPDFLEQLDPNQAATVMSHEGYHVLFFHTSHERAAGMDPKIWNISVDYVVNGVIETDHEESGRKAKIPNLWEGPLGTPIPLDHYIEWIDGKRQKLPEPGCFADVTVHGRSPESIYDQIRKAMLASPRRCKESKGGCGAMSFDPKTGKSCFGDPPYKPECCQVCGCPPGEGVGPGSLDCHMPSGQTKDETLGDMMRAAEQTRAMGRGDVPGDIEEALGRLKKPELSPHDIIRACIAQHKIDAGNINDYKRFRRRPDFIYEKDPATGTYAPKHRLYHPRKQDFIPKWVALMDTSGSMGDEDIANGVKELQLVADVAEGWIVPCDATPYWDSAVKISNKTDIKRTKVVGRGGTVFQEFFQDLPKQKFGDKVDLMIIITDGDCDQIPMSLRPAGADVLWIITNKRKFTPNFGRVCQLRPAHA